MSDDLVLPKLAWALRVLADCHTRDDDLTGFVVMHGGSAYMSRWSSGEYIQAWEIVRRSIGEKTEPTESKQPTP